MSQARTTFEIMEELRGLHISTPRDAEFQRHLSRLAAGWAGQSFAGGG